MADSVSLEPARGTARGRSSVIDPQQTRRRRTPMVAAGLAAVLLLLGSAGRASAHPELVSASPAPDASLPEPPAAVVLVFSEAVAPDGASIRLTGPFGRAVEVPAPEISPDGRVVTTPLPPLEAGGYVVSYEVVSTTDGHLVTGRFAFLIDPTGAAAPPVGGATSSSPSVGPATILSRWLGLGGLLVAFGTAVVMLRGVDRGGTGSGARARALSILLGGSAGIGALGAAGYLWLASGPIRSEEGGFAALVDPAAPYGWTWFAVSMRVAILSGLTVAIVAGARRGSMRRGPRLAAALLAGLGLAGVSGAGHAAALGGPAFAAVDWMHLLAAGAWLGAIPGLLLAARSQPGADRSVAALLRGHAPVAIVAAPVVVLTGLGNAAIVLGDARDVVASQPGNLLLAKAALLAVAVALGAVNHLAVRGRGRAAVGAILGLELLAGVGAVGAAAALVTLQPAAVRQPETVRTPVSVAHLFAETDGSRVHLTLSPAAPVEQSLQVTVADRETLRPRDDVEGVRVRFAARDGLAVPREVALAPDAAAPGLWAARGAFTPTEGDWDLVVRLGRRSGVPERASFVVPVESLPPNQLAPPPDASIGVPAPIALLWPLVPPGPLAWGPMVVGLVLLALVGRSAAADGRPARRLTRGALVGLVVVAGATAGSRALVDAANEPPAGAATTAPPVIAGSLERGERLYRANCAACHGIDGRGTGPIRTLPGAGSLRDAVRATDDAKLSYRIANGVAGTAMPPFADRFTERERWDLVAHLRDRWGDPN